MMPENLAKTLIYRAEIDGLRAISISLVLLFHLDVLGFSGGWMGVDVFFVISGFLISRILFVQNKLSNFSFIYFYSRRFRRLFPALLATVTVTFAVALVIFTPSDLTALSKSSLAALFSLSNVLFWSESGYWDQASHLKPLLHTWSLSVEEQFYLIWPLIIFLSVKSKKLSTFTVISALGVGSFLLSAVGIFDSNSIFYIFIFRIFEFAAGGALGIALLNKKTDRKYSYEKNLIFFAAISILVVCFIEAAEFQAFMGLWSLVFCFGVVGLIYSSDKGIGNVLLTSKILIWLGTRSYSIYLVHWPLIVFYKYSFGTTFSLTTQISLFLVSLLLGEVLYRCVEQKFRLTTASSISVEQKHLKKINKFGLRIGCSTAIAIVSFGYTYHMGGLKFRFDELPHNVMDMTKQKVNSERFRAVKETCIGHSLQSIIYGDCFHQINNAQIVILGNSHGVDALNTMRRALPDSKIMMMAGAGCLPTFDYTDPSNKKCAELNEKRLEALKSLNKSWSGLIVFGSRVKGDEIEAYKETIRHVSSLGHTVIVFGNAPSFNVDVHAEIIKTGSLEEAEKTLNERHLQNNDNDADLYAISKEVGGKFYSKYTFFCNENKFCSISDKYNNLYYFDSNHLTLKASHDYADHIREDILKDFDLIK